VSTDGKAVVAAFWESLYAWDWPRLRTFLDRLATSDQSWMVDVTAEI
jgi:hypothetical protein